MNKWDELGLFPYFNPGQNPAGAPTPEPTPPVPDPNIVIDISVGLEQFLNNTLTEAISVSTFQVALSIIEARKEKCKCLKTITIFAHGTEGTIYTTGDAVGPAITSDGVSRINNGNAFTQDDKAIIDILIRLKKSLCQDGRIVFYGCHSGLGVEGSKLEKELSKFFGFPIDLPETQVRPAIPTGVEVDNK